METTKKISIEYTQNKNRKMSKHVNMYINKTQRIWQHRKRDKGTAKTNRKTINNIVMVSPFLSIIALNVSRLNSAIKKQWLSGF